MQKTLDDLDNVTHNGESLLGGAALHNGVFLMTNRQVAVGYCTEDGRVLILSRPLPGFLQRLGFLVGLAIIPLSWWAMWLIAHHRQAPEQERMLNRVSLLGMALGFVLGITMIRLGFTWGLLLMPALLLLHPQVARMAWHIVQDWRRYHGAEHQLVHAVLEGQGASEASVSSQPILSPYCGTNLLMLVLPLIIAAFWMPGWFDWLALPALLLAMFLMTWAAEREGTSRLARALLAYGALGQRLTVAQGEARHRAAAIAAWEALGLKK